MDIDKKYERIIVYDFETTGTYPKWDRVIQASLLIFDNPPSSDPPTIYNSYVKLGNNKKTKKPNKLPKKITELTGITDDILQTQGKNIWEVFEELYDIFNHPNTLVVGYNHIKFDNSFLRDGFRFYLKKDCPEFDNFDTFPEYKAELLGQYKSPLLSVKEFQESFIYKRAPTSATLKDAVIHYQIEQKWDFHDAYGDIQYTYQIFLIQSKKYLQPQTH